MSDSPRTPSDDADGGPDSVPAEGDGLPVARPVSLPTPSVGGSGGTILPPQIFDLAEDRCPKCGNVMGTTDVVCLKCGYDFRANAVREVETGEANVALATDEPKVPVEFVMPGRLSAKTLGIVGGVLAIGALVASGVFAPSGGAWVVVGLVVLCAYQIVLHTATGVAAVAVAAKLSSERFGRHDLALGRMFVAFSLFQLLTRVRVPTGYTTLNVALAWAVALAAYYGTVMILFRKDRAEAALIALSHFMLWILLNAGMELSGLVGAAVAAGAKPTP